ncbi:YdcH family protein [Roseivivax sp. CAU 1761]
MSLSSHLQELKKKHQTLSERVEAAQRAPGTDGLHIAELKKQKLRLKEEITRLSAPRMH